MRRSVGGRLISLGIGIGFGILAGLVGIAQWILTVRDLAGRLASFSGLQGWDATGVVRGNELFWLGTAALAGVVMVVLCGAAAFAVGRLCHHQPTGVFAGLVAAVVSGATYIAATPLAITFSPEPGMIGGIVRCEIPLGMVFCGGAVGLALLGASMGARASG